MTKESKSKNISLIVFSIFIYIAILAIVGMFQIFIFDTDPSALKSGKFWIEQGITSTMYFSAYIATAILRYTVLELKEEEYNTLERSIKKHRQSLIGQTFRAFINKLDFRNKKETWEDKIRIKIDNHSKRITRKVFKQMTEIPEEDWGFWTRWYVKREKKLKLYLTDEWINEHLKFKRLKYPEITPSEVINGTLKFKTSGSMINRRHLSKQIKNKLVFVFMSIVATAIWATIIFQEIINPLDVIGQIIFTLAMLLVNIITGYFAAGMAHRSRIIATTERLELILDFIDEPKQQLKETNPED